MTMMPKEPAGVAFGLLMALAGLVVVANFRGIIDYHAERSIKSARSWSNPFGPPSQWTAKRRAELRLLAHIIDRILGLAFLAAGVAMMWQAWHGTLINRTR
jgi:uncharacterized protein YjeT (DUF2065 family)